MLGLRYAFTQPHQANWMTDGTMDWLWPAAEKAGIPIALMASNYLPQVGQIAERHPGLKLIIDHYARVRDGKDDAAHGNQPALLALAKHPNVAVKCTGAPGNSSAALPLPQHPQIHPADRRGVRAGAQLLGHRHHPHAVLVEAVRDDVHRRDAVAQRPRPRARHGPRGLRLARLEPARLTICPSPRPLPASGAREKLGFPRPACGERVRVRGLSLLPFVLCSFACGSGGGGSRRAGSGLSAAAGRI